MQRNSLWISLVLFPGLLLGGSHRFQQEPSLPQELVIENVQIAVQLEYVELSFLVRDLKGRMVVDLQRDDFLLLENGQPRQILAVQEREVPISAVVMVDTSISIGSYMENALRTAVAFFDNLTRESSAFVLFSEKPQVILNWDQRPDDLWEPFKGVKPKGKTALHDSVIWVSRNLFAERAGKKLIILLSDGIDTASQSTFEEMIEATRQASVTLYPIIYTNAIIEEYRRYLQTRRHPQDGVSRFFHTFILRQNDFLAQSLRYGGRTIFSSAFNDLHKIYGDIIHEMKSHYVMYYRSEDEASEERKLEIQVRSPKNVGRVFVNIGH